MKISSLHHRRAYLQQGLALLLLVHTPHARAAKLLGVRIWPAREYTRVSIESDVALQTKVQFVGSPPRLAVDIEGLQIDAALRDLVGQVRHDDPFILGLRVGQYDSTTVRLVFDLRQPVRPQWLNLAPVESVYQYRLLLDLFPLNPIDPIEALIDRLRQDSGHATDSTQANDPIADLWQRHQGRLGNSASQAPVPSAKPAKPAKPAERIAILAIDAGHGGEDPGAIGKNGTLEKDVALTLALKLHDRINQTRLVQRHQIWQLRSFLTRDGDYFVPLHRRVQKAHQVGAELFVSIHADAFTEPDARGGSVYALSQGAASSATARWIAQQENRSDAIGGLSQIKVEDPQVRQTMFAMSTAAQIRQSLDLGEELLNRMKRVGQVHKRHVEQAGFAVLRSPEIPSLLIESAFISNPKEEELLNSAPYQDALVKAWHQGIVSHLQKKNFRSG